MKRRTVERRRVVVTGLGMVSPLGLTVAQNWEAVCAGTSGIGPITLFDVSAYPVRIAGEVRGFDPVAVLGAKDARRQDRFVQLGLVAGMEAIADAGIDAHPANAERIGVYIGAGIGGMTTIESTTLLCAEKGPRRVSPFYIPSSIINMIAGNLSIMYGLKGPNLAVVTACSTATHAIGEAARMINYGDADVMVAGGAEAALTHTALAGFASARALSERNDDPARASRPWDRERDGFVMGEGAGVLVLEEYEHARRRGARIYAEVSGYGLSGDAHHITSPPEDGEGAARCMRNALADAGINADQVQYVNAHGTSTPLGDRAETIALKQAFGDHARRLCVSSTKSMTGHLLGAAGGVEAIYTTLAIHHGVIPPTINLDNPDEDCDLDFVPHTAREAGIEHALSNSFGFGGTNGTLVLSRLA